MFSNSYDSAKAEARRLWWTATNAAMNVGPVRRRVREWALAGQVPRHLWIRLPVTEPKFEFSLPGGHVVRYHTEVGDPVGQSFYWRGIDGWEAPSLHTFLALAKRARHLLDIGANTGAYTLIACACNDGLQALAYEPVPRVFERLARNIAVNDFGPRCRAKQAAVSNAVGVAQLHVPHSTIPSSASLRKTGFRNLSGVLLKVPVTTADHDTGPESVDITMPVDLVKIDVEGFEDHVLAGMTRILESDRPVILCECNPDGPTGAINEQLRAADYHFWHVCAPRLERMPIIRPDRTERHRNFVFVPAEDRATADLLASLRLPTADY